MAESAYKQPRYVTCPCQHCSGKIEFDGSELGFGETRLVECPHCHMETHVFTPPSATQLPFETNQIIPAPKTASNSLSTLRSAAIILWVITGILFFAFIGFCCLFTSSPDSDSVAQFIGAILFFVMLGFSIAAAISTGKYRSLRNPPKPPEKKFICANCGTLWPLGILCSCGQRGLLPLGTPRGQELFATYHGSVTAKARIEIGDEAAKKLLRSLETVPASGSIAVELEKLAGLVRIGAINNEEWQRAKALYLGQPKAKQESSLARIQQLHGLCRSGAISESEFNMVKWDILSKGMS